VLRLLRGVTGVAAAILVGGSLWLYVQRQPPDVAAPDPWEQMAILMTGAEEEPAGASLANGTMPAAAAAPEVELAQWIVTDLSIEQQR
jgi:hypothetical protein